jgi:hypothetical protein
MTTTEKTKMTTKTATAPKATATTTTTITTTTTATATVMWRFFIVSLRTKANFIFLLHKSVILCRHHSPRMTHSNQRHY